jgi:hypothetical protein
VEKKLKSGRPLPPLRTADVVPLLVPLIELSSLDGCKYSYGDSGNYRFCGLAKISSNQYCGPHMVLMHLPADAVRERRFYQSIRKVEPIAVTMPSSLAA